MKLPAVIVASDPLPVLIVATREGENGRIRWRQASTGKGKSWFLRSCCDQHLQISELPVICLPVHAHPSRARRNDGTTTTQPSGLNTMSFDASR